LTPLTCKRRRHCWTRWRNATPVDTLCAPQHGWTRVYNLLSMKRFHEALAGNVHECSL
jgi:hypothetical protein